jgi:hypothetical protein
MREYPKIQDIDEEVDENEYFEEEVESEYETMLSTIPEGDHESCSSRKSCLSKSSHMSPKISVPQNISLTPADQRRPLEYSSKLWTLVSPMMFSPVGEARKLKIPPQKSPLFEVRQNPSGCESKSSTIQGMPLVLTSLASGEQIEFIDLYDDEYTFVSCDTESTIGAPVPQSVDDPGTCFKSVVPEDEAEDRIGWSDDVPGPPQNKALDFEATRRQLENALGSRMNQGKLMSERMDYMRRKLRYDLQRKMIKEG